MEINSEKENKIVEFSNYLIQNLVNIKKKNKVEKIKLNITNRYITIYFLGHLCKMLKINNRYSSLYEEEMAKYRVEVPELEEADDEDVFNYIIGGD